MPISKAKMRLYPGGSIHSKEWRAIRGRILARAGDRCEGTDQFPSCRAPNRGTHPETGSRVVLTIAHLNHCVSDNSDYNLRALCQRCHLAWDAVFHRMNARVTNAQKAAAPVVRRTPGVSKP